MTAQAIHYGTRRSATAAGDQMRVAGPRILPFIFFVAAVVAVFFSMIYLHISLDQTAFELDRLGSEIRVEQSRQLDLRYDLAGLQDPLRIATEAQRIGLVHPHERIALVVDRFATNSQVSEPEVPVRALTGGGP